MKKIKFRAWHIDYKRMYEVNGIDFRFERINVYSKENPEGMDILLKRVILTQYTGLKDKNGREIYEGDIVQVPGAIPAQVYWDFGSWQLRNGSLTGGMIANFEEEDIEVIGNIYENPELLKGKDGK